MAWIYFGCNFDAWRYRVPFGGGCAELEREPYLVAVRAQGPLVAEVGHDEALAQMKRAVRAALAEACTGHLLVALGDTTSQHRIEKDHPQLQCKFLPCGLSLSEMATYLSVGIFEPRLRGLGLLARTVNLFRGIEGEGVFKIPEETCERYLAEMTEARRFAVVAPPRDAK